MFADQSVALRSLTPGNPVLSRVADCTSRAFSNDPLIIWLQKPGEGRWGELKPAHQRFQQTRLSRDLLDSRVAYASLAGPNGEEDVTGVCVLHPPPKKLSWLDLKAWWRWILSMWKNWWNPLVASDCDQDRLKELFALHDAQFQKHTQGFTKHSVWYLEVVATDPSAQGKGVGGSLMRWVIEQIGDEPCFLECTDEKTVPFYEKYGFKLMEATTLTREVDKLEVELFWMLRSKGRDSVEQTT